MKELAKSGNHFLSEAENFFGLHEGEIPIELGCSSHLGILKDNLFVCRFLYDCTEKGIEYHRKWIEKHLKEIAKRIKPEQAGKIVKDFESLISNRDLIVILAYEFFIDYLADIIRDILLRNTELLKGINEIHYRGSELVEKITTDPSLILDDLINLTIYRSKERGNLRTSPDFWIKLLVQKVRIELPEGGAEFWVIIHERRNASGHSDARKRWERTAQRLFRKDVRVWLYGLLYLAYQIDDRLRRKHGLKTKKLTVNFCGDPYYSLKKVNSPQCE